MIASSLASMRFTLIPRLGEPGVERFIGLVMTAGVDVNDVFLSERGCARHCYGESRNSAFLREQSHCYGTWLRMVAK